MHLEDRLRLIFTEDYQVRRVVKELETVRENKQKLGLEVRYISTKSVQLAIIIQVTKAKLKQSKSFSSLEKLEFKVALRRDYPAIWPQLYLLNDNAVQLGINPFHDYMRAAMPQWNLKTTVLDIIRQIPAFVVSCIEKKEAMYQGIPEPGAYFEPDRILLFRGCQPFPVKLIRGGTMYNGMLVVVNGQELIVLQMTMPNAYSNTDFISIKEIVSVHRHKTKTLQCMIEVRKGKNKYGLLFATEDSQILASVLIQAMKASQLLEQKQGSEMSSSEQEVDFFQEQKEELVVTSENISDVQQEIVVLQSLVDNSPTANNVQELMELLKKSVQYYSMKGDERCHIHLQSVQQLMGSQLMQILVDSQDDLVPKSENPKQEYESIANCL